MINIVIPSNRNVRKKESEKLKKYQGLKKKLENMWKVKAKINPSDNWSTGNKLWPLT